MNRIIVPLLALVMGAIALVLGVAENDKNSTTVVFLVDGVYIAKYQRVSDYRVDVVGYSTGIVSKGVPLTEMLPMGNKLKGRE